MQRTFLRALIAGATCMVVLACGDGGDDGNDPGTVSQSVGSACSEDSDCGGYDNALCTTGLKPLEDYVEDTGEPVNDTLRELTLPFPGGYCTSSLEADCSSDAQCGDEGGCFMPFEGVSDEVITGLDDTIPELSVPEFATRGVCLDRCETNADCRGGEGYTCIVPIPSLLELFNPEYSKKYCMQDEDYSYILMPPEE